MRIGLTGGIGSGKSTIARFLEARGAILIDADGIARDVTASGGAAIGAILQRFGEQAIDKDSYAMNREFMRQVVFCDPAAKANLEDIVHPIVRRVIAERLAPKCESQLNGVVVVDIPLLIETGGWTASFDQIWVVDCESEVQKARILARSNWSADQVEAAIASQASRTNRRAAADTVIYNGMVSLPEVLHVVDRLASRFGL